MDSSNYSDLTKTWLFDLDGTLVKHNGYKNGGDELLPGVLEFFSSIPENDVVIILTARSSRHQEITESFLQANGIYFDYIIYDLPIGERILINDRKPSGLKTAYAYNLDRDAGL